MAAYSRLKERLRARVAPAQPAARPPGGGSPATGGSALGQFLARTVSYEQAGAEIPRRLLAYAAMGASALLVCAALFAVLPEPASAHHSGLLLIGENITAWLLHACQLLIFPLLISGTVLIVLDGVLFFGGGARRAGWHYAVAAQPFIGVVGAMAGAGLLALVVLNIIIYTLLMIVGVMLLLLFLGAVLSG